MLAFRVAGALHVIASHLEPRGIRTRIGKDSEAVVQFMNEQDAVGLRVEEEIEEIERVPTVEEKRRPSWEWQTKVRHPSGRRGTLLRCFSACSFLLAFRTSEGLRRNFGQDPKFFPFRI